MEVYVKTVTDHGDKVVVVFDPLTDRALIGFDDIIKSTQYSGDFPAKRLAISGAQVNSVPEDEFDRLYRMAQPLVPIECIPAEAQSDAKPSLREIIVAHLRK